MLYFNFYIQLRAREHLLPHEVEAMVKAARSVGRHGNRDAALILIAYRHGLRVSEVGLVLATEKLSAFAFYPYCLSHQPYDSGRTFLLHESPLELHEDQAIAI